ncbi:MAG TPA: SH3 domain-containing protein [Rhizomicrobium sp.]|nr:SH3 domain-containing protein [Rhizomicrobium sp.]
MQQRAAKFSKKAEANAPAFASISASDIIRVSKPPRLVPLELSPLLAPFKRHGRLALRLEYVPQMARLSAGRNNGDGSWSLASDELEGLIYQVPENLAREHTLLLRVMSFKDGDASTLKILHIPVGFEKVADPAAEDQAETASPETSDPILHNELGRMQSLFAVRESDLAELRAALAQARSEKDAALAQARAAWDAELLERVSQAVAKAKADWQLEHNSLLAAQAEARIQHQTQQKAAQDQARWREQTEQRVTAERQRWKAESLNELAKAIAEERQLWQAEADRRFEAERQGWKSDSLNELTKAITDERGHWQAQTEQRIEAERSRWAAESQNSATRLVAEAREQWLAQSEQRLETERRRWQAESRQELTQAIAQERALWQGQADQRIQTERLGWETEKQSQIARAVGEERDYWQAQTEQRIETERQRWKTETLAVLSEAEARWKADEASRSAALLAEGRAQAARALADASEKCRALELALEASHAQAKNAVEAGVPDAADAQENLTRTQALLAERELELAIQRRAAEEERQRGRQGLETALAQAAEIWKKQEDARFAELSAQSATQAEALASATSRVEAAELALAEAKNAVPGRWDDAYVDGLRRDISTLRTTLVNREVELGRVRKALEDTRPPRMQNTPSLPVQGGFRKALDMAAEEDTGAKRGLVREFFMVVCVVAPVFLFYPYLEGYLPDNVRIAVHSMTGGLLGNVAYAPPVQLAVAPPPPPAVKRPTAIVARSANLRAIPALKGSVVATLERGAPVAVLGQSGNWTEVETRPGDAKTKALRGFVYSTYLKSEASSVRP